MRSDSVGRWSAAQACGALARRRRGRSRVRFLQRRRAVDLVAWRTITFGTQVRPTRAELQGDVFTLACTINTGTCTINTGIGTGAHGDETGRHSLRPILQVTGLAETECAWRKSWAADGPYRAWISAGAAIAPCLPCSPGQSCGPVRAAGGRWLGTARPPNASRALPA